MGNSNEVASPDELSIPFAASNPDDMSSDNTNGTNNIVIYRPFPPLGTISRHDVVDITGGKSRLVRILPIHVNQDNNGNLTFVPIEDSGTSVPLLCRLVPFALTAQKAVTDKRAFDEAKLDSPLFVEKLGPVGKFIPSTCGRIFDRYVRECYDGGEGNSVYSLAGPATKEYPALWSGRRLKILLTKDSPRWHAAKIKTMEHACDGPLSAMTKWFMTVEFEKELGAGTKADPDDFSPGERVQVHGLQSETGRQHNGKIGVVIDAVDTTKGRYPVQLANGHRLSVKPCNLHEGPQSWKKEINRMHPITGGTLQGGTPGRDTRALLSFEWMDPPDPEFVEADDVPSPQALCQLPEYRVLLQNVIRDPAALQQKQKERLEEYTLVAGYPVLDDAKASQAQKEFHQVILDLSTTDLVAFGQRLLEEPFPKAFHWSNGEHVLSIKAIKMVLCVLKYRWARGDLTLTPLVSKSEVFEILKFFATLAGHECRIRWEFEQSVKWYKYALVLSKEISTRTESLHASIAAVYVMCGQFQKSFCVADDANISELDSRELEEWTGTSQAMTLEDGLEAVQNAKERLEFLVLKPGMVDPTIPGCPINFPNLDRLSKIPQDIIDQIRDNKTRASFVSIMGGNFRADFVQCKDTGVKFVITEATKQLERQPVLLKLHFKISALDGINLLAIRDELHTKGHAETLKVGDQKEWEHFVSTMIGVYHIIDNKQVEQEEANSDIDRSEVKKILDSAIFKDGTEGYRATGSGNLFTFQTANSFLQHLRDDAKEMVAFRVLHLFLKFNSNKLKLGLPVLLTMVKILQEHYKEMKKWRDLYDIRAVGARLSLTVSDEELGSFGKSSADKRSGVDLKCGYVAETAEALEALGKFTCAAQLYFQASKLVEDGSNWKCPLMRDAAIALTRGKQYALAESLFVYSLHYAYKGRIASKINDILITMRLNYISWADAGEVPVSSIPFLCLLHVFWDSAWVIPPNSVRPASYLKPDYRSREAAKLALYEAFVIPEVDTFRGYVQGKLEVGVTPLQLSSMLREMAASDPDNAVWKSKESVRTKLKTERADGLPYANCSSCKRWVEKSLHCPCKAVFYCDTKCQMAHWEAGHKDVCPFNKKKSKRKDPSTR